MLCRTKGLILLVLLLPALVAVAVYLLLRGSLPQYEGRASLPGLWI